MGGVSPEGDGEGAGVLVLPGQGGGVEAAPRGGGGAPGTSVVREAGEGLQLALAWRVGEAGVAEGAQVVGEQEAEEGEEERGEGDGEAQDPPGQEQGHHPGLQGLGASPHHPPPGL